MNYTAQPLTMVMSYWGYVALLPMLFIVLLVHGLIGRKN